MIDFAAARRMMVEGQVRTADVTDLRIIAAMLDLPREKFVPAEKAGLAYLDLDVPVFAAADRAATRCLLKPMVLAKLIQAADIAAGDSVLDVGCATGYSSALLGRLAGSVMALEENKALAQHAADGLAELRVGHVAVASGTLTAGWSGAGPYDVILLNGAVEVEPTALFAQLKPGGRLLCIRGSASHAGKAMLYYNDDGDISGRPLFDAAAPLLPGFAAPEVIVF
jgi:protein-L-isoaspartate(D-aspartate) O-methyltransferase